MFVYGCAVCIYGRITMTNVRCGKHLKWTPPCALYYSVLPPTPYIRRPTQGKGQRATPCRGISLMCLVRRKHFANILSSSEEIRNIYRFAQHITHLISILVLLLSSLDQCPVSRWPSVNIDTTWLDSCHAPFRTDHLFGHLSRRTQAKSSFTIFMRSFVVFPCMLRLIRRHSHYRFFLIPLLYSLFAKGLSLANDCDLRRNKDLSILITAERGLIVRK